MKKIYLFIAAAMIAVSCSDDDNKATSVNPDPESLIGTWKMTSWKIGELQQDINFCQEEHDFLKFDSSTSMVQSFGELDGVDCTNESYNNTYSIANGEIHFKEVTSRPVPFQQKYKILDQTDSTITIRQFWSSQETPSGEVSEEFIPENEQETYTYIKQ